MVGRTHHRLQLSGGKASKSPGPRSWISWRWLPERPQILSAEKEPRVSHTALQGVGGHANETHSESQKVPASCLPQRHVCAYVWAPACQWTELLSKPPVTCITSANCSVLWETGSPRSPLSATSSSATVRARHNKEAMWVSHGVACSSRLAVNKALNEEC